MHFGVPGITNYIPDRSQSKSILSQHKKFLSQVKIAWCKLLARKNEWKLAGPKTIYKLKTVLRWLLDLEYLDIFFSTVSSLYNLQYIYSISPCKINNYPSFIKLACKNVICIKFCPVIYSVLWTSKNLIYQIDSISFVSKEKSYASYTLLVYK